MWALSRGGRGGTLASVMGRRPKPVFPRVTADDAPRLAAELFVECLESEGVEYIFGIPGEETLDLNEALDRSERITFVPTRHAQGAAFIGVGYEGGALLVGRRDERDALRPGEGLVEVEGLLARDAEDVLDAFALEALDEELGGETRRVVCGHAGKDGFRPATHD